MSDGTKFHGTTLAGATAGTIGNIISLNGPGESRDSIDISTADSPDEAREFLAGMIDSGEISLSVNFDGSAGGIADSLHTAFLLGTAEVWTITWKDGSIDACSGFITSLPKSGTFDDKITQDITIKLTGVVTFTDVA